jgi:lipopolysaccharide export LptBFGC system permease protein LptF
MRAVGQSYGRLLRVPYALTAILIAANVALVFYIQPVSRYWYERLNYELQSGALGVFVAIVMVVAYHKVNQYGQDVAALGRVDPIVALWAPFALFAALILWMYYRVAFVPGGQAIGALETAAAKVGKRLRKLVSRRRPAAPPLAAAAPAE